MAAARQSVEFADRSRDRFEMYSDRTTLADALHQAGEPWQPTPGPFLEGNSEAERLFREAEQMQQEKQPEFLYLYSVRGFQFCDLLLSLGQAQEVLQRIEKLNEWWLPSDSLLDIALEDLAAGRAWLLQGEVLQAARYLYQAVAGLREAGTQHHLPRGLLARAALFRVQHEFDKAWADLHEAHEIAERGEMRLWLTDYHLETARLIREQLSVNSKQLSVGGEQLSVSGEQLSVSGEEVSWEKAREHLEKAAQLVEKTGYHRRDREVEELRLMLDDGDVGW